MPCPACKIILNGGFMAVLAHHLAHHRLSSQAIANAASKLADAARILVSMLATAGFVMDTEHFAGCDQAQKLVEWIADPKLADEVEIRNWTAEAWTVIADLAAGKLPEHTNSSGA